MYLHELEIRKNNQENQEKELEKELENDNNIYNNYYLFNILSDEMIKIKCDFNSLKEMIYYLIYSKYKDNKIIRDDDFIIKFKNIFNKYFKQLSKKNIIKN